MIMVFFSYKEREKKGGEKAIINDNPTTVSYLAPL